MTGRQEHLDGRAVVILLACCAFWGFQQILIKFASREIPPLWQASVRMAGPNQVINRIIAELDAVFRGITYTHRGRQ